MTRTRIAPSPTGYPHIGSIYQALFDFAYAKKNKGRYIIRIEDTDRQRFVPGAEDQIYQAFDWFGLIEDESPRKGGSYGPYRQSERLPIYQKYALELVEKDYAYYCFCSKERLIEVREKLQALKKVPMYDKRCRNLSKSEIKIKLRDKTPYVIRLRVPENNKIVILDQIRGQIEFDSNNIDDQVLLKTDGFPTYHLASTVDDHLMEITHVIRGEEWLSSTPKHFLLYEFFGWNKPLFFHTPDLRNPDKSKLSKRHGHTNVSWYKEQGFLPCAILNFLALMGWSHPEGKEIFPLEEFINLFDPKDLKPVGPIFDLTKLSWMNGEYVRMMSDADLADGLYSFLNKKYDRVILLRIVPLLKERIKILSEAETLIDFFFQKPQINPKLLIIKKRSIDESKIVLENVLKHFLKIEKWSSEVLHQEGNELVKKSGWKPVELFQLIRIAISGKTITPPLFESMEIIGKEEILNRLKKSLAFLES